MSLVADTCREADILGDMGNSVDVASRMDDLPSDAELLRRYALSGEQADLAALVHRYVDLVYSAARRRLRDAHAAQDVTQQVFVVLLRKGRQLRADTSVKLQLVRWTAPCTRNHSTWRIAISARRRNQAWFTTMWFTSPSNMAASTRSTPMPHPASRFGA